MIKITSSGDFKKTRDFLDRLKRHDVYAGLEAQGQKGVEALRRFTPVESGLTAESWYYRIVRTRRSIGIEWYNSHEVSGTPLPILLQYGHATGTGGYVQGRDFINPAMRPIFDEIAADVWKEVTR
jgi:hypothetical protein